MKKSLDIKLVDYLLDEEDFRDLYVEMKGKMDEKDFKESIKNLVAYCLHDEFNPFLDEEYMDISWMIIDGHIINLDDISEEYKDILENWD